MTQFESMNSADLRDDFLQNKGDSLLLQQSFGTPRLSLITQSLSAHHYH